MTDKPKSTFARRIRAARPRDKRHDVRDDVIGGLTLRIYPSGVRTFALERLTRGRRQFARIGDANGMTVPEARREARSRIASYIEPAKRDNGPSTPGHPMTAFADEFFERQARHWKPRTLETNRYLIRNHILPAFGHMAVEAIADDDVRSWFASMAAKPGTGVIVQPRATPTSRTGIWWRRRRPSER